METLAPFRSIDYGNKSWDEGGIEISLFESCDIKNELEEPIIFQIEVSDSEIAPETQAILAAWFCEALSTLILSYLNKHVEIALQISQCTSTRHRYSFTKELNFRWGPYHLSCVLHSSDVTKSRYSTWMSKDSSVFQFLSGDRFEMLKELEQQRLCDYIFLGCLRNVVTILPSDLWE